MYYLIIQIIKKKIHLKMCEKEKKNTYLASVQCNTLIYLNVFLL